MNLAFITGGGIAAIIIVALAIAAAIFIFHKRAENAAAVEAAKLKSAAAAEAGKVEGAARGVVQDVRKRL